MSVIAALLVKDEADILRYTLDHLATQVDSIVVMDNLSTDGTREIAEEFGCWLIVDDQLGYWQAAKTTWLADRCREQGHDWLVPCDADEMWVTNDGRPIREWLRGVAPDVAAVAAAIHHYIPTAKDSDDANPFSRIGWRLAEPAGLPKVCARLTAGLSIDAGNHGVKYHGVAPRLMGGGLRVNHYSWRSPEQFARKIRNGARAYAATDLPESTGQHWRMWGDPEAEDLEERAAEHYRRYFYAADPPCAPGSLDPGGLVYDPATE